MAIKLRRDAFRRHQQLMGWTEIETASKMGVSKQTLWRTKLPEGDPRHTDPSAEFVAGALRAFRPLTFEDLFLTKELHSRNETSSQTIPEKEPSHS